MLHSDSKILAYMQDDDEICRSLARRYYDKETGARALQKRVETSIRGDITGLWQDGEFEGLEASLVEMKPHPRQSEPYIITTQQSM